MKVSQTAIHCAMIRGGTSRGAYFLASDLPRDEALRNDVLRAAMGGPDALQVDGLGGGHPLTSKVAVVSPSEDRRADVDYLFLQLSPATQSVSSAQNCGNILAGVGPFAIDSGLVAASEGETTVRVRMLNSNSRCDLLIPTRDGAVLCEGDTEIDGVPGSGAAISCHFLDTAGSTTGALLPTGVAQDKIEGFDVTLIDNGMPVVILRADDFGISGNETPDELDGNEPLKRQLETLRLCAGPLMNLGDVADQTVPKMCLVSRPVAGGQVATRMFVPHVCHQSIGVLGAVTVATACLVPGSIMDDIAERKSIESQDIVVEHPSGTIQVRLAVSVNNEFKVRRAGIIRTARTLMRGEVFVPRSVWDGKSS